MQTVTHKGGRASYHDPHIPTVQPHHGAALDSIPLTAEALEKADCVVLTTNHATFDTDFIKLHARLIVDLRNMIEEGDEKVYKL